MGIGAVVRIYEAGGLGEDLEFLGDAVLDFVISDAVFKLRPEADEGDLSRLRSSLVKDSTLAAIATELDVGEHVGVEQLVIVAVEHLDVLEQRDFRLLRFLFA